MGTSEESSVDEKQHIDPDKADPNHQPGISDHHHTHLPFHHHGHRKHHLSHLIHPTGKHFHIVHQPHEVEAKRAEIANHEEHSKHNFDVVIYGTPEHLSAIRDIQNHQISRRESLRHKNAELFQEFDELHDTLDHLNDELSRLTDHAVALDASFSKFGYSAHVRTKDDVESASLNSSEDGSEPSSRTAEDRHKDRSLEPIRFYRTPTIRQYFHKGVLWRSARSGEVASFELFVDLVYVGVIDYVGESAVVNASSESFLHFVIVFALAYKIWSDLTVTVNWFEVEDCVGRLLVLFVLCCLYGFNSNVEYFFSYTYTAGISFYLTQRMFMTAFTAFAAVVVPMIRGALISTTVLSLIACALYIAAVHVDHPYSVAVLFPALFVDYGGGIALVWGLVYLRERAKCNAMCSKVMKAFEFMPAINIEHRVERTSAFTTLVFGYSILKSLYQSHAHVGVNAFLGKGMLSVVQAFTIMWIYFDIDGWAIHVHAIRRHWATSSIWILAHLPLSAAFILASSTLSDLVLAHDCANSDPHDLAEAYESRSVEELEQPMRWFYCGGLAVTLLCMTIISWSHIHKKVQHVRITKKLRLAFRLCVAIILVCLPLAHELSSLELIGITTSLFVVVLVFDIFGNTCPGEKFFTGGIGRCEETRCKYTAKLKLGRKKRDALAKKLLAGETVNFEDALRRTDTMGSETTLDVTEEWAMSHA